MCWNAETRIVSAVCALAQQEWELVQTINLEEKVHPGIIIRTRKMLVTRGDQNALALFDAATGHEQPNMEKARALIESAEGPG